MLLHWLTSPVKLSHFALWSRAKASNATIADYVHRRAPGIGTGEIGGMAKLTEQEQQEIIRFMEAGKPLPDKYRFLLFEDKREVELVWNG